MADYRYIFLSLRTDEVIEEIPLFGVNFTRRLNEPGELNGTFQLDQTGKYNIDLIAATTPGKTWIVAERDGVPVWWGMVWSRTYQSQAKTCQLYCWGFEAWPQREKILYNFVRTSTPNDEIFADLWTDMMSIPGRDLGIDIPIASSGPEKDLTVLASDNVYYGDPMQAIANASDGFDWTIACEKTASTGYNKKLRIGTPGLGTDHNNPSLWVFEYPGNILNYYETESMANAGTHIYISGKGESDAMPVATYFNDDMVGMYGWPRWDVDVSFKDISELDLLQKLAEQQGIARKPPMPTYKITIKGNLDPVIGSYNIGDSCKLVITDSKHPRLDNGYASLDIPSVIIGMEVTPQSSENSEEVNIILPGDVENG